MKCHIVGGWVRDRLLEEEGFPVRPKDRDWVVLGETPEAMVRRGFKPVGGDFPIFLHPKTHEEYALARTERKTAPGYHGFVFHAAPDVTLEDDLRRRDLTINAIAMDADGNLTDPYGGAADLRARVLRHVSEAFAEDPVRILRCARFAARFPEFTVAPETMALMRGMVDAGEADALVPERVQAEFQKGLETKAPERMFEVLLECGFWARLYADVPMEAPIRRAVGDVARAGHPMAARLAAMTLGMSSGDAAKAFLKALRSPVDAMEYALTLHAVRPLLTAPATLVNLRDFMVRADALRRPERAEDLIRFAKHLPEAEGDLKEDLRMKALAAWRSVDAGAVAHAQTDPKAIPGAVLEARTEALRAVL